MWLLTCDGDVFEGKSLWLRPGQAYIFGRTRPESGKHAGYAIRHKSVSRQHVLLSVEGTSADDLSNVEKRPEITLKDEATKFGTIIDGEKVHGGERKLNGFEHIFRVGNYESAFHIRWLPMVFTFTFPGSASRNGKDPLAQIRGRLASTGIKCVMPYLPETTHVVAKKRNTAKCLQALVNGRYIVDHSFLDALVFATTPSNLTEPESLCPLEEDFEKNWPDAETYLPLEGKDGKERPALLFHPDAARKTVFQGYTFVFLDQKQYDNLYEPIEAGSGKALIYEVKYPDTKSNDIRAFVKSAIGDTRHGELADLHNPVGIVVVTFPCEDKERKDWALDLQHDLSIKLGMRLIDQGEFLDAILNKDARPLRRVLESEIVNDNFSKPKSSETQSNSIPIPPQPEPQAQTQTQPAPSEPVAPFRRRGKLVSVFTGFDDGFSAADTQPARLHTPAQAPGQNTQQGTENNATNGTESKKRPHPENALNIDEEEEKVFPAAAAMKKRRLQSEAPSTVSEQVEEPITREPTPEVTVKEMKQAAKARRENELKQEQEEYNIDEILAGMTVSEMQKLAVIEDMEVLPRPRNATRNNGDDASNPRWNPEWNGRKNFKKFRRKGEGGPVRRGISVIVPLEEVKAHYGPYADDSMLSSQAREELNSHSRNNTEHDSLRDADVEDDSAIIVEDLAAEEGSGDDDPRPAAISTSTRSRPTRATTETPRTLTQSTLMGSFKRSAPTNDRNGPSKRPRYDSDDDEEAEATTGRFRLKR